MSTRKSSFPEPASPEWLRATRKRLRLSRRQAANEFEVAPGSLDRWETEGIGQRPLEEGGQRGGGRGVVRQYRALLSGYRPADWPLTVEEEGPEPLETLLRGAVERYGLDAVYDALDRAGSGAVQNLTIREQV